MGGWDVTVPPQTHFPPPTSPSLACRGRGSPDKGTLQGTAQTQPRGAGGAGLGGAEAAQGPPTSTDTGDQWGGTGQNKQTNKRQRDEAEQGRLPWPQLPPQVRSQPQVGGRGVGSGWELARMRREGSLAPPQALSTVAARTGHHPEGWPSQPEAPQLCVGMFLPCRSEGDGQMDLLPHSQPAWSTVWLPLGARGSRCALKSPQAGISSSFILVGAGTGNPFLASSSRSQSFSCARLSSVMPWAASSARTLSR